MEKGDKTAAEPNLVQVRALATQHVDRTSLRVVAREIGITRGALHGLVQGRKPQARIWGTLKFWYARAGGPEASVPDDAYRRVPVDVLRDWLLNRLTREGYREIAADVGLHHSTLHAFVNRVQRPSIRVRRAIALDYLKHRAADRKSPQTRGFR